MHFEEKNMKKLLLHTTLTAALALGCAMFASNAVADSNMPATDTSSTPAPSLAKQVKAALADPALGAKKIKVSNKKGVITLSGTVPTKAQADQIVDAAGKVAGVKSVVNHIDTQDSLAGQVKMALGKDASLHAFNLKTHEKDGVVTISGSVEEQVESDKAVTIAKGVPGVTSVVNHINVMQTN